MSKYRVVVTADDDCASEMIVDARTPEDAAGTAVRFERKRCQNNEYNLDRVLVYASGMKHIDRMANKFDKVSYNGRVVVD